VHEIAIRVHLKQRERFALTEYERLVSSVASVSALIGWLPTPDARLVLRGRGAEPVRIETMSYGAESSILVVLDQRTPAVEKAAGVVAALLENISSAALEGNASGVAGELDRLDQAAPRGRSALERSLRAFLEGARADVVARRTTARVRAASALLRLAEDGATLTVERIEDASDPILEATVLDVAPVPGDAALVGSDVLPVSDTPADEGQSRSPEEDTPDLTGKSQKTSGSESVEKGSKKAKSKKAASEPKAAKSGKAGKSGKKDKKKSKKK
jgi:hypothetical protein